MVFSHQMWSKRGLKVQQNADDGYLLQPLAAGLLAVFLVLASIVEARPQGCQQLLGQRAQGARRRLAEDHVPSQLQGGVCCRGEEEERDEVRKERMKGVLKEALAAICK